MYIHDDTEKSDNDKERDKVNMTGSTNDGNKEEENKEEEKEQETEEETTEEETEEENKEEDNKEEDDKEEEKKELTAEQKQITKLEKTIERLTKRVDKTAGERNETRKELAAAKAALEAKLKDGEIALTEEEVERRAEEKAKRKVAETEFENAQKKLIKEATKIDPKFMTKINELAEDVSPLPGYMIGILEELDNGGAVLNYLTDNPDEYEEIYTLSPTRMATRLAKVSDTLEKAAKPKPKNISKVPPPNEPIKGGNKSPNVLSDKMPMDEWVRLRNQQSEDRRKQKMR